jgi:hypothetical protein
VKVRGTAAHVAEKYLSLARDAQAAGDIISAENYLQHAEHYARIVMAAQAQMQQQPQYRDAADEYDDDRPMNGRRDRFDFNGDNRFGDEEGDDRFEPGMTAERGEFRPRRPHYGDRDRQGGPYQPAPFREQPEAATEEPTGAIEEERAAVTEDEANPVHAERGGDAAGRPRRRRPPRGRAGNGTEENGEPGDTTDGAAALAAFPD